ncbi:Uncharacterized protein HZ326_28488, partial [Fusarium oxysporum f. sp. albedinis]
KDLMSALMGYLTEGEIEVDNPVDKVVLELQVCSMVVSTYMAVLAEPVLVIPIGCELSTMFVDC